MTDRPPPRRQLQLGEAIPELVYLGTVTEVASDLWDATTNPDGIVSFAVAENVHVGSEAITIATKTVGRRGVSPWVPFYGDFRGHRRLREAVADHLRRHVLLDRGSPLPEDVVPLDSDDLLITNGCGPALEHLTFALCDPGDAILTLAPIYPGFLMDVGRRAGARLVTVPTDTTRFSLGVDALERARTSTENAGHPVRALLLSSPHNPLGTCFSIDELAGAVLWCARHDLHLITDEIYAASVFSSEIRFTSTFALTHLATDWALEHLHLLYGFSKDLGLSGLRIGVIGTRSAPLRRVIDPLMYFCGCSHATQDLLVALLEDTTRRDGLLARNRSTLARLYGRVGVTLDAAKVPYVPAQAGFFVWCDLRRWLEADSADGEQALWRALLDAGVLLIPGLSCRAIEPGYFRLCFAAVPEDGLQLGLERLTAFLQSHAPTKV